MIDQDVMCEVLRRFARTMAGTYDVTAALYDLSDTVVQVMGATAAGVALLDGDQLRFVTATNSAAAEAESLQERLQEGPCMEAIRRAAPVPVGDMRDHHDRWPDYGVALEEVGFRAVLGLPLVLDDQRVGSLDVYDVQPRTWEQAVLDAGLALADITAAYVLNASALAQSQRTTEQLQTALDTRVLIEQAKGVLAERLGVTTSEAFERIRTSARTDRVKITEVCRLVIDTDHVPGAPGRGAPDGGSSSSTLSWQ